MASLAHLGLYVLRLFKLGARCTTHRIGLGQRGCNAPDLPKAVTGRHHPRRPGALSTWVSHEFRSSLLPTALELGLVDIPSSDSRALRVCEEGEGH